MPRGRPPKKNKEINNSGTKSFKDKHKCFMCGKEYVETSYYKSYSVFFSGIGRVPYCKQCIEKLYKEYCKQYIDEGYSNPEKEAIQRLCMAFDIFYSEDIYNNSMADVKKRKLNITPIGAYMKMVQLSQYTRNKQTYDTTLLKQKKEEFVASTSFNVDDREVDESIMNFFGNGFSDEDYKFLKREYDDWTARHECNTKAQEEVFKRICFKQLEILKATRKGEDTKNLDATFQNLLDTAKLQPKQNKGDTTAENQTFGTLIDKWENERPLPEIDEELKDVDKIGLYIDIFFRSHLAKMVGIKNGISNLYTKFMKKYTVEKPEYREEEDSEILFDTIFGSAIDKDEGK